jgi:hypothetical protein
VEKDESTEDLKKRWGMQNCTRRKEESKRKVVNKRKKGEWRACVSP